MTRTNEELLLEISTSIAVIKESALHRDSSLAELKTAIKALEHKIDGLDAKYASKEEFLKYTTRIDALIWLVIVAVVTALLSLILGS